MTESHNNTLLGETAESKNENDLYMALLEEYISSDSFKDTHSTNLLIW